MASFSRTISRIITDASQPPVWRREMVTSDRLYYVGNSSAGQADGLQTPMPTHFGQSQVDAYGGAGWDVMTGYSSGTLLEDVGGPWGMMVYGTGGHTRLQNQLLGFALSADSPTFNWWQQPQFQTRATNGAELYYNPAEFDALPANRKILSDESVSSWDKGFPVGFDGWIYPNKMTTGQLGNNCPHGFRYSTTCFVPSSVTGGDSVLFASLGPQGPFAQAWKPSDGQISDWLSPEAMFTARNGTVGRRQAFYFKNTRTGVWAEHKWQPDYLGYGFVRQSCGVFRDLKRIYISGDEANSTAGWWYIDMSNGLANFTRSNWFVPSTAIAPNRYASGAWTDGHPANRHLVYFPDLANTAGLVVQDFDTNQQYALDVGKGLNIPTNNEWIGMSYDARLNRILVLLQDYTTKDLYYYAIGIPSDPRDAAGYTVSKRLLSLGDPAMQSQLGDTTYFYRKTQLHPTLGIILVPFGRSRMLGFIPS
jgi:hypothetical protein